MRNTLTPKEKLALIARVADDGVSVTQACKEFGVSRFTFYKWFNRYQKAKDKLEALASQRPTKNAHWHTTEDNESQQIINYALRHPRVSVNKIDKSLPVIGRTAIQRVLQRNGLSTKEERELFSHQVKAGAVEYPLSSRTKIQFLLEGFPPLPPFFDNRRLIHFGKTAVPFFFIFSLGYLCCRALFSWGRMVFLTPGVSPLGLVFATISLLVGGIFFLYSAKTYLSLALVLSTSRRQTGLGNGLSLNGQEGKQSRLHSIFTNFLQASREKQGEERVRERRGVFSWLFGKELEDAGVPGSVLINGEISQLELERKPFVSIHLPMFNEKRVARRIIEACAKMEYFDENGRPNFEVLVCDDSSDETVDIVRQVAEGINLKLKVKSEKLKLEIQKCSRYKGSINGQVSKVNGQLVRILHRPTREGFKGGALKHAIEKMDPRTEFIMVFDADFVPFPDTISQFLKHYQFICRGLSRTAIRKSKVGAITGYQWHVLNKDENWITKGVRTEYSGSYLVERPARELVGGLKIIHGSVYMARAEVLKNIGWGTSITEDFEMTLKLYEKGYKVVFTPYVQAPAECVSTLKRLSRQRMRWAEGHSNNIRRMFKRLIRSPRLSFMEKLELLYLSPYYLQAALFLVGNICWLIAELVFRVKLPFWTSLWGWSMVLSNLFALPLMNSVGLFVEESKKDDYLGILSFIALCYLVVPFQAYASVKGFLEKEEGTWFRTPKSGKVTISLIRSRFSRLVKIFFPLEGKTSEEIVSPELEPLALSPSALNRLGNLAVLPLRSTLRNRRRVGRVVLASMLIMSTMLWSLAPIIPYSPKTVNASPFGMLLEPGYQSAPGEVKAEETEAENRVIEDIEAGDWKVEDRKTEDRGTEAGEKTIENIESEDEEVQSQGVVAKFISRLFAWLRGILAPRSCDSCRGEGGNSAITGFLSSLRSSIYAALQNFRHWLAALPSFFWNLALAIGEKSQFLREQLSLFEGLADEDSLESGSEVAGYQKTLKKDFQAREIPELIFHFPENKKPSEGLIDSLLKRLLGSVRASSLEEQASSPEEYEAYLYDYMGKELNVNLELSQIDNQSVKVIVPPSARLKPGAYVVKVELTQDGEIYTQEQDFTWGVLAININKSIYLPGETAKLAMAVLDEKGEMVCDALLRLEVKASQGKPSIFTTEDGTIRINPECYQKAFTLNPDYEAEYQLGEAGEYEMVLTAETENGTYTIYDSFEVRESMPFEIERTSATRIFPVEAYPMQITIRANEDFSGFIEETVPASFDIQSAGESLLLQETIEGNQPNSGEPQPQRFLGIQTKQDSTEIIKGDDSQKIRWQVDWRAGNIYQLSYFFNAPDQSPAAFTVGPLRLLLAGSDRVVFIESRVWQLAIDAVETRYMRGVASEVTVNGLTTYSLGTSQSTTAQSSLITTGSQNGRENQTVDWGIRVYTRTSVPAENEVTLGTPVAQVQRTYLGGNTEGIQSNTWACPQTAVNATDSVVVRVFAQIPGYVAWTQQAQFTTEQLGASQLDSATWTVYYYTKYYTFTGVPSASRRTEGTFYWGTTTPYNSRITNFSWTEPTTTVSGIVYLDNESTIATSGNGGPCDGTTIIGIRVNGGSETTTTCDGSTAAYSISVGTITSGDTVTAYLTSTDKANTVYVSDGGGTDTGINLFLETVIVRDEPDGTITIPDTWDWDESTESPATNMLFDAVSGSPNTLTVETGKELHVWTGDIFDPGGTVTTQGSTGHLHVDSTASAYLDTASNAIGGNAIIDGTRLDFDTTTTVTGDVTVAAGATANFDANTTINGGDITVAGSGIVASSAGTVTMGADGTIGGGTGTFNLTNLTISGSGTETILGAADSSTINVSGDVDIGVGAEIAMNDKFLDVNGGSVTTTGFGSMITCTGCTAGGLTLAGTGTLGGSEDDIVGVYNLTLDGSTATTTVSSEIDVMNNLVVGSGRTLSMGSNSLSVGRSTVTNSGSIDISGTLTQSSSGITSIASSSGGAATIGGTGSITFYNLFFTPAATSTFTLGSAASQTINVLGQMRIGNGSNGVIVTAASNNPTLDVDGEFEINNAATFIASETGTFNVAGNWDNNGTFTHSSGEVTLNASSGSPKNIDSTGAADDDFFDLTLNDGGGPVTWELGSNLDVDGTLHIAGGTLDVTATDYQVNVAGDWDNDEGTGGFTAQDGTVVLDGAAESIQAVTGATNFYSLTATTGDRIIEFGANETFGWSGTLTFQGTDCDDMLVLRSSAFDDHAATSKWTLTNSGSTGTLQYLDVQDSTVSGSAISASYSVASGGNTNWTIAADDCVGASTTNANATGYSFQRKTFYDEENERYWLFYHDGDEIQIRWSSDHGANWNATNTDANGYRPYSTNDFSVWWKTISEVEYVWLAVNDGGDIKVIAGTLSSNDISWDNDVSTALNESGTYSYPYITLDSDDYVWVGANYNEGSNYVYKTATTYEGAASQKGTTDLSTWNWTAAPHQISDDQGDENVYGNIVALSSPTQDMYATFVVNNAIEGCTWDFSDTAWEDADGASCTGGGAGGTSVTIEQQINIIDQVYTSTTTETFLPTDNSLGLILWDGTKYNGASVYFEAIIRCVGCTGGGDQMAEAKLYTDSGTAVSGAGILTVNSSYTRVRSNEITSSLVDGEEYTVRLARMDDVGTAYIQAARLIIVQSAPTITDTVTQVEVGNNDTTAVAAYELLTDHKIYQWDEDKFSGNVSVYFEATLKGSDAAAVSYAALSSDSCSSQVSNSEVSVTDVTWDRQRSSALSLIDDTTYYVCVHTTAADTGSIATAKIIIEQTTDTRGLTDIEMVHQYVNTSNTETSDTYVERDFDNEFNPDNWSGGTFGYYFESTAKTASGTTGYAKLKDVDNTDEIDNATTSELNATTASYARYRSSDLASNTDWPSAAADLDTIMKETASSTVSVSSSSLIIQASGLPGGVKIDDDGDPAGMSGAGRQVVRTSDGDLYAVIRDGSYIEVWKSEDGGANWEEQDSDHKEACYNVSDVAIAIDSTGTIHIYYQTSSTVHKYTSFSTSGGTFSGSTTTLYTANTTANDGAIAVDSNDKVHVVMTSDNSVGIETLDVNVKYTNNVSGWKTPVTVETKASSGTIPFSKGDIVINEDDVPEVSYCNKFQVNVGELTAAEGDANNAASFTVHDIDSDVNITSDQTSTSIAIDSVGNTWVAYVDEDGADNDGTDDNVTLAWHADSQADWTLSWTTDLTNSNVGYEPSIAVLDEDIYVFYQDYDNNHIVYDKYDANATTWGGETILRAAIGGVTYQDAKAKYSSLNNFYGPKIDFLYSDGTDIYWDQLDVAGHINDDSGFDETVEAGRQIVRLSDGTLYAVVNDSGSVEVWKSADGSSWSQQDSIDSPACANTEPVTVAVDSSNVLHLAYLDSNSPADIDYVTFTTSTSQFGTAENVVDITGAGDLVYSLSLVLDDNDIPHIVYGFEDNDSTDSVEYRNRVGGAPWGSATVESGFLSYWTDITISEDNIPEIVYINSTDDDLTAAVGNQNDATTFGTPYDTDATVNDTANQRGCSIGIDSSGNTWIAYVDSDSSITVVEHLDASAWTSWETAVTNSNVGYEPSIAIDSTDIYVIYEDDNDDIVYDKYDGSDWSGETVLETGTFQDVKARWSYLNSYDSSGTARVQTNTYYFDGSDVPALDGDGYWVGETNADDGDVDTFATSINASTVTIGELKIEGTNGTDQGTISSVKARVYGSETGTNTVINAAIYTDGGPGSGTLLGTPTKDGTEGWGSLATLSAPGGTWDWSEVQALEVYVYITSDGSPIVTMSKVEILVESTNDTAQTEFDYLFSDDTDAYYNYFVPSAAGGTAGSQDAIDSLVVSGLTKNLSLVVGSNNDLHLIYMADLDTDEVVYRRRDASTGWDVLATTIDASGTNAYLTLSINTNDTNLNDLYAIWIDTSDNHIYYEKCDVSEAGSECSTATDWAQTDWKNPGSDTYTNVTSNFSGDEHVFAMWTIDSIAPYHVSWSYIVVPEYLLMFVLFAPLFPGLFKYAKKRWAPGFLPSGA